MIVLSAGWALGLGCFLDASPYENASGGDSTTNGGSGAGTTTTTPTTATTTTTGNGGGGGVTTSTTSTTTPTETSGGGGTGGSTTSTSMGGGGEGGSGGSTTSTTGPTSPVSCTDALQKGILVESGVTTIDPDGPDGEQPIEVWCDQVTEGGGWALVFSSVGSAAGTTTAFWDIPYEERLVVKPSMPGAPPDPGDNYYAGRLYLHGREYRDDVEDVMGHEVKDVMRATVTGFTDETMDFVGAEEQTMKSLSSAIYGSQFNAGWSSADKDYDPDPKNCAETFQKVTQHYAGCWLYSLGAGTDDNSDPALKYFDMGWGPHMINSTMSDINVKLTAKGLPTLTSSGGFPGQASRLNRITRYTRWPAQ